MDKTNIIGEKIKGLRMAKEISLDERGRLKMN